MAPCQTRRGLHANNPSAPEVEAGGSEVQGNPWLCGEFKGRLERKEREREREGERGRETVVSCQHLDESSVPEGAPSLDLWGHVGATLSLAFSSHQHSDQLILLLSGIHLVVIRVTGLVSIIRCY